MKKILLGLSLLILATGCADVRSNIAEKGASASDAALETAEWTMCYAASIGSVKRRYGASKDKADAYNGLCSNVAEEEIITGETQ